MWKLAIVGCGNIAGGYDEDPDSGACQTHAKACALRPDLELTAVCDRDELKAARFANRWSAKSFYTSTKEMLEHSRPDIVALCSPTPTHAGLLEDCLNYGGLRAVLCEKPAGLDPVRLGSLLGKFEASGLVLAINYIRAYCPGIQDQRKKLTELGGCTEATVTYGKGIFNYGSHAIQWLSDWLGEISEIHPTGSQPGAAPGDPLVNATFRAGTTLVHLRATREDRFDVNFCCRDGILEFYDFAYHSRSEGVVSKTSLEKVMLDVYASLTERLAGKSSRLVGGDEALATLKICHSLAAT